MVGGLIFYWRCRRLVDLSPSSSSRTGRSDACRKSEDRRRVVAASSAKHAEQHDNRPGFGFYNDPGPAPARCRRLAHRPAVPEGSAPDHECPRIRIGQGPNRWRAVSPADGQHVPVPPPHSPVHDIESMGRGGRRRGLQVSASNPKARQVEDEGQSQSAGPVSRVDRESNSSSHQYRFRRLPETAQVEVVIFRGARGC